MDKPIFILNGPNLNLTGKRVIELYGHQTLSDIQKLCEEKIEGLSFTLEFRQTNHEGLLIDWIQEAQESASGLLLNAGGFTHTSIALADAVAYLSIPVIEVHLSQPWGREPFRRRSYISRVAQGVIAGFGATSYLLALDAVIDSINKKHSPSHIHIV